MWNRLVSIFYLAFICVTMPIFYLGALLIRILTQPVDSRLKLLHLYSCLWSTIVYWAMPAWKFVVSGRERIDPKATYVVVSNHQSQLDILAAFRLFFHFKWVSKIEVFKVPFMGWNMRLNRYIPLVRGDKESIREMMAECRKTLESGSSIFMFPEGTRSETGVLRAFKPGAFQLAHELQLPILPIAIDGTIKALPKYSLNFHGRQIIDIQVLEPVPYDAFKDLAVEETAALFRNRIGERVSAHRDAVCG